MDIRWFDTLESTNNYCKLLDLNTVGEFAVVAARNQTAGIGQQGNVWVSEAGKNLTFSLILKPTFLAVEDQYQLTMAISVAIAETIESQLTLNRSPSSVLQSPFSVPRSPFSVHIKWPNDIYVGDRKICGTLITNQISGSHIASSICGIGLNVNQTDFPDWVPNPTSLRQLTSRLFDLDPLLQTLLENIQDRYRQLATPSGSDTIKQLYLNSFYRLGIESDFIHNNTPLRATITGIDRFGHLQLTTFSGRPLTCAMKEIKFI